MNSSGFLFTCAFERQDGAWRALEAQCGEPGRLSKRRAIEFLDRMHWLEEHNDIDAVMLYLSKSWTASVVENEGGVEQLTRQTYSDWHRRRSEAVTNYMRSIDVLGVSVSPDGQSAEVKSRITETGIRNGEVLSGVTRARTVLQVQDGAIVVTGSEIEPN